MWAMTADQFLARYCRATGLTGTDLNRMCMGVMPCACGDPCCPGWRIVSPSLRRPYAGYNIAASSRGHDNIGEPETRAEEE